MKYLVLVLFPLFIFCNKKSIQINDFENNYNDTTRLGNVVKINYNGKVVLFYGDSITEGYGASDSLNRWTNIFCSKKNATGINYGVSGKTMVDNGCGNFFNPNDVPVYDSTIHAAIFIAFGTNDVGARGRADILGNYVSTIAFRNKYESSLAILQNVKLWPAKKIINITPYYAESYNSFYGSCYDNTRIIATQLVADSFANIVVDESKRKRCKVLNIREIMINEGWGNSYFFDSLHFNNAGNLRIANTLNIEF